MYTFREVVPLGVTSLSPTRVAAAVATLRASWMGKDYDVLGRNCNHFCEALCEALGCEGPPGWLNAFARNANSTRLGMEYASNGVSHAWEEMNKSLANGWAFLSSIGTGKAGDSSSDVGRGHVDDDDVGGGIAEADATKAGAHARAASDATFESARAELGEEESEDDTNDHFDDAAENDGGTS